MLIFGHKDLAHPPFKREENKKNILYLAFDSKSLKKLKSYKTAVLVKNTDEGILANALGADFLLVDEKALCLRLSELASFYLFDSRILFIVDDFLDLYKLYKETKADGVVLKSILP